jgi:MFS family permease
MTTSTAPPEGSFLATGRGRVTLALLGGRAGDLLGRRRLLIAGTALFAVSSLACGRGAPPFPMPRRLDQ